MVLVSTYVWRINKNKRKQHASEQYASKQLCKYACMHHDGKQ